MLMCMQNELFFLGLIRFENAKIEKICNDMQMTVSPPNQAVISNHSSDLSGCCTNSAGDEPMQLVLVLLLDLGNHCFDTFFTP